jgi:hypothetical protein
MSWLFAVEALVVLHEFCAFLSIVGLPRADFIGNNGVNVYSVSSLGGGAMSSSFVVLVLFDPKGLVELGACIWAVGSSLTPFAVLFLSLFCPFFKCPGC